MTIPAAEKLREALKDAIGGRTRINAPPDLAAGIYTKPYEIEPIGRVPLPNRVRWRGLPEYRASGPDGPSVDPRPTLVVDDDEESFWPLIVRMPLDKARKLRGELAKAIRRKKSAMRERVLLKTPDGKYVGARGGGGASFTLARAGRARPRCTRSSGSTPSAARDNSARGAATTRGGGAKIDAIVKEPKTSERFAFEWLDVDRTRARLRTREGNYVRVAGDDGAIDALPKSAGAATVFTVQPARK